MNNLDILLNRLATIFPNNNIINLVVNESDELKLNRIKKLNNSITSTTNFNYLLKNKIKLFSHKEKDTLSISESLFGSELTLKKIFNYQDENLKLILWTDLKEMLLSYNEFLLTTDNTNKSILERIEKLKLNNLNPTNLNPTNLNPKEGINKILNTANMNETTNDMINDIFGSFENSLNSTSGNPFNNILNISQEITSKYKDKIENGDINLEDLLKNVTNLPGMENISGILNTLTKQMAPKNEPIETVVIDENFSTAIVPMGNNTEPVNNLDLTALLKTMNSLGSMGFGNSNADGSNLDMTKMMGLFNKLGTINDPSELNNIFEKELGMDMTKFTQEISNVLEK